MLHYSYSQSLKPLFHPKSHETIKTEAYATKPRGQQQQQQQEQWCGVSRLKKKEERKPPVLHLQHSLQSAIAPN